MKLKFMLAASGLLLVSACADCLADYKAMPDGASKRTYHADLEICQNQARAQYQLGATAPAATRRAGPGKAPSQSASDSAGAERQSIVWACLRARGHALAERGI